MHIAKVVSKRVPATRRELAYSIQWILVDLFGGWLFMSNGGCRSTFQARNWCLLQVDSILQSGLCLNSANTLSPITQTLVSYALFGIKDVSFDIMNWGKHTPMILDVLRQRAPVYPSLRIGPSILNTGYISKVCKRQDSFLKYLL